MKVTDFVKLFSEDITINIHCAFRFGITIYNMVIITKGGCDLKENFNIVGNYVADLTKYEIINGSVVMPFDTFEEITVSATYSIN